MTATPESSEPQEQRGEPARSPEGPGRFGLLLLILILAYLLSAFASGPWVTALRVALFGAATVLAMRASRLPRPLPVLVTAVVLAGSGVMLGLAASSDTGAGIANVWAGFVLLFIAVVIVRRILMFTTVTLQSIYGALSAYLIIGLMFASFFAALNQFGGQHFFANSQPVTAQTLQYFSFTTLTTLGYGDFTAAGNAGRAIAVLEALTGQIFLVTLVARLVSAFGSPNGRDRG